MKSTLDISATVGHPKPKVPVTITELVAGTSKFFSLLLTNQWMQVHWLLPHHYQPEGTTIESFEIFPLISQLFRQSLFPLTRPAWILLIFPTNSHLQ